MTTPQLRRRPTQSTWRTSKMGKIMFRAVIAFLFTLCAFTATANDLGGFGTPDKQPLVVSFIGTGNNNALASVNTVTFTAQAIGAALADRYVAVAFHIRGNVDPVLSSATIGGVSATILQQFSQSAQSAVGFIISSTPIPTGTTANITLNFASANALSAGIFIYIVNQLLRPSNIIGSGTLLATATNPAVIGSANSEGGAVEFWIMRNSNGDGSGDVFTPVASGSITGSVC